MAKKEQSKAEQRRARRHAQRRDQRKAEQRAKRRKARAKAKPKTSRPKPKPRRPKNRKPKTRRSTRGTTRRTSSTVRRTLGLSRRAAIETVERMPRRDRLRAKRRRARNHVIAVLALFVTSYLLVDSFSTRTMVFWLIAAGACAVVFRAPRSKAR